MCCLAQVWESLGLLDCQAREQGQADEEVVAQADFKSKDVYGEEAHQEEEDEGWHQEQAQGCGWNELLGERLLRQQVFFEVLFIFIQVIDTTTT